MRVDAKRDEAIVLALLPKYCGLKNGSGVEE